jgi:PAS domain S-box-containing protein
MAGPQVSSRNRIPWRTAVALAAAAAALGVMAWISWRSVAPLVAETANVQARAHDVELIKDLLLALQDAETGQRGFLITGRDAYLEPYTSALNRIDALAAAIRSSSGTDPAALRRVDSIDRDIRLKLEELHETVELRRSEGFEAAAAVVADDRGKVAMDRIRVLAEDLQREHALARDEKARAIEARARDTNRDVLVTLGLAVLLLASAGVATWGSTRRRQVALAEAEAARHSLEHVNRELAHVNEAFVEAMGEIAYRNDLARDTVEWRGATRGATMPMTIGAWLAAIHPDDRDRARQAQQAVAREGRMFDLEYRWRVEPDGDWRWIHDRGVPQRDASGRLAELIGVMRDVTDRHAAANAEAIASQRLVELLKSIRDGFVAIDLEWRYTYVNDEAAALLGRPREEMVGRKLWELFPEAVDTPFHTAAHEARATGHPISLDLYYPPHRRWYRNHMYPTSEGISVFFENITSEREAQHEISASRERLARFALQQTAAVEAERARMAREIHDELGQAFTGLKMDLGWLQRRLSTLPPDAARPIRERLDGMSEFIAQTINTVRRLASELRPAVLDALGLAAALRAHATQFSERSDVVCELDLREVRLDRDHATGLFRIGQEALTNVARHAGATRVRVVLAQVGEHVVLEIEDDGCGFDPDEARHDRDARSGLGLLGVGERARMMGGDALIDSGPGRGTLIRVRVPVRIAEPVAFES